MGSRRTKPQLWDRQPGESTKAWESFKIYRDLGTSRSLAKVSEKTGKGISTLGWFSSKYSWVLRCAAWDAERDRLDQLFMAEQRKAAVKRHVLQAQALANKWVQALQTLNPAELTPSEIIKYAEVATKMERTALGLEDPAMNVKLSANPEEAVEAMSSEDVQLRLQALIREVQKRSQQAETDPDGEEEPDADEE